VMLADLRPRDLPQPRVGHLRDLPRTCAWSVFPTGGPPDLIPEDSAEATYLRILC
jgi:hypothetical protein